MHLDCIVIIIPSDSDQSSFNAQTLEVDLIFHTYEGTFYKKPKKGSEGKCFQFSSDFQTNFKHDLLIS